MERPPPIVPQIVAYLNFDELARDARKFRDPWVVLRSTEDLLVFVHIDEEADVDIKLTFHNNFKPMVAWQGSQSVSLYFIE